MNLKELQKFSNDTFLKVVSTMHSHDRTLIANLGFVDSDKQDSKHDLACQYIASLCVDVNHWSTLTKVFEKILYKTYKDEDNTLEIVDFMYFNDDVRLEHPITKGSGQYKTIIGFLDVTASYTIRHHNKAEVISSDEMEKDKVYYSPEDSNLTYKYKNITLRKECVCFEIKVNPVSIGDMIRQINLYREFHHCNLFFLITLFDLTDIDIFSLESENIHHAKLGSNFEKWCAEQKTNKITQVNIVEL